MSIAIRAEHVSKEYRLGIINHGVLFRDIQSWWARKRGREDPHEKIGTHRFDDQTDRFWALKDVSFEVEQGDRVGIIGRNGAGKSTLLKILSRITEPTEGKISIRGRVASLLEVGTGFHHELTGRDNIYLSGAIQGMKRREISKKIDEIIDFSEIRKFIDTPVKRYSSGMYVRLAFAVAAHLESEILLADEVLAVGDQEFQKKCLGKMEEVSKHEGRTVLFVSHNLGSVSSLCNSGVLLESGKLSVKGEIQKVIAKYIKETVSNRVLFKGKYLIEAAAWQDASKIYVEVIYNIERKIEEPCLGIKVYSELGEIVYNCNPYNYPIIRDPAFPEPGHIIAEISGPPLYNGAYFLSLSFANGTTALERQDKCLKLEVHNMVETKYPPSIRHHGAVHPECVYRFS